jgi:hypothetical protein
VDFIDADGNIIVPKAVRPTIGLQETSLGSKKGARRQYRYGTLHIRDYDSHYTVHVDRVDPRSNPLGHLLADAPEYLAATAAATLASRYVGRKVYSKCRGEGKSTGEALAQAAAAGLVTGLAAGKWAYDTTNNIRKKRRG